MSVVDLLPWGWRERAYLTWWEREACRRDEETNAWLRHGWERVLELRYGISREPCQCCCNEHTFSACPARTRGDCRGQWSDGESYDAWRDAFPDLSWDDW